jgi:Uma2 family endonuclease
MDEIRETALPYRQKYTYRDYANVPGETPCQLIGGDLVLTPPPSMYHQRISAKLVARMRIFAESHDLGEVYHPPTSVYFNEEETYQPDIVFIAKGRTAIIEADRVNGAPDLVIEILSPSTAHNDLQTKFKTYEKYALGEYWIIDPDKHMVDVYRKHGAGLTLRRKVGGKGLIESKVLPGFKVDAEYLFSDL